MFSGLPQALIPGHSGGFANKNSEASPWLEHLVEVRGRQVVSTEWSQQISTT